jgi:hypothetical protein
MDVGAYAGQQEPVSIMGRTLVGPRDGILSQLLRDGFKVVLSPM